MYIGEGDSLSLGADRTMMMEKKSPRGERTAASSSRPCIYRARECVFVCACVYDDLLYSPNELRSPTTRVIITF